MQFVSKKFQILNYVGPLLWEHNPWLHTIHLYISVLIVPTLQHYQCNSADNF